MNVSTATETAPTEVQTPCEMGECASCGATVLVTDSDEMDSLKRYGPHETCECGGSEFVRVSVDEALK